MNCGIHWFIALPALCASLSAFALAEDQAATSRPSTRPAGVLIIEGQIVDHIGAGIKDVEVRVFRVDDGEREQLGTTTTDEMGDFKLHGPKRVHGTLVVALSKTGFQAHEIEAESEPDELPPFVDFRLSGALALTGTVHDALKDEPVSGAKVTVRSFTDEQSATTESSGRFEVTGLAPGKVRVVVEAEGFARQQQTIEIAEQAEPVRVRLEPERIVHLSVTNEQGEPIAGATVESLVAEAGDYRTFVTGPDGRVTLRGLGMKPNRLTVRLSHARFVSSTSFDRSVELPEDAAESSHTLIMKAAGAISGNVLSAERRPLGGARLTVGESLDEPTAAGYSEFDGTFQLTGVPPGEAVVTIHLAEYAPQLHRLTVAAGASARLEVTLSPASRVQGRVSDPDGKPVPGAHVVAARWREGRTLGLQAMTDAEGRFFIADAPSDEFSVDVYAVGFRPLRDQSVQPGGREHEFKFTEARTSAAMPAGAGPKEGEAAPAFEFTTLDGRKVRRDALKGKWVLLDFWATWCGPCVVEMPQLEKLHGEFGGRMDFELIGISLDMDEQALRKFVQDRKIAWAQVFGDEAGATRTAEQFGVVAIPMTYLIGPDGKIAASGLRGEEMGRALRKRLTEAN